MGICLDTDASAAQDTGEPGNDWNHTRNQDGQNAAAGNAMAMNANGRLGSANIGAIDMQNAGKIKFDPPKVPVIFVLGGPGSGKVTHCDTFMQERRGVTHINMMDLLQQYAMGNDMQDFSQLSSKTVTEVLMLEMKMAPAAKAYLISGYPRSMRDVVEYSEKIQVVNGVILISWRQSVLQKQIDYGAKLGHVVLSLAKMELENFFKNVMPVADYFDQSDMLLAVNGERAPTEVYKDFRTAVLDILSALENQEAMLNGVTGMGRGIHDIPGSIVSVDTAPSQPPVTVDRRSVADQNQNAPAGAADDRNVTNAVISHIAANAATAAATLRTGGTTADDDSGVVVTQQPKLSHAGTSMDATDEPESAIPPIIWVIGGPGSNKATLCLKAVGLNPGWSHISVGRLLRNITDTAPRANTESYAVKEALAAGEMAPEKTLNQLLDNNIRQLRGKTGIIIDGYPRNLQQVKYFENKYKQIPPTILLDCSKLQLGRGRIDDTVSSFRRRLELFREQTLPMLKTMDTSNRLQIVDGDTDSPSVQREFERLIRNHIQQLTNKVPEGEDVTESLGNHVMRNEQTDAILHDLETNVPGSVPTISHHVSMMNGHLKNRGSALTGAKRPTQLMNGHAPGRPGTGPVAPLAQPVDFRHMLEEAERYPVDSYM
ncbi:adenylate kinase isoenzyme 5 isoform X1 [Drosophila sulfurigaster albostrigata]|uniref:adenylate kinase isoenzyme 5 isoform X1 n=1 Tax=Drosophila sulfurigaster albostrigata TaxID=89887 RepID=UPI002D21B10F|nr:adenylate kinase isoenzyme 5 isoform X1 [Drosophila sulfurigaster albostrigata]